MKNTFKVSVVIPNYNGKKLLGKNLPEVLKAKQNSKNQIIEIIVVDDASFDGSVGFLKKTFPQIRLIKHKKNRGFSSSVNMGVRMAKGDLVVLLNTDVIPAENFLESVLLHFEDEKIFAVSLHETGFSWAKGEFKNGFVIHSPGRKSKNPHITFWVSGGSGVFRRKLWNKLGGMDEKLLSPFYWEDIDLSYRALKRGYEILWEPKALVEHKHESTISKLSRSFVARVRERNELLFIWKNITSPNLFRKHIAGLFLRVVKHPGYMRIVFMALMRLRSVISKRKKEIKDCKISDEAIFARF